MTVWTVIKQSSSIKPGKYQARFCIIITVYKINSNNNSDYFNSCFIIILLVHLAVKIFVLTILQFGQIFPVMPNVRKGFKRLKN